MCELIYKLGVHKNDKFFENKITADEFNYLTNSVGWGTREIFIVQEARFYIFLVEVKNMNACAITGVIVDAGHGEIEI